MAALPRGLKGLLLAAAFACSATAASQACITDRPFSPKTIETAATIVRARVIGYELIALGAVLTIEVLETYRGNAGKTEKLLWFNSTFSVPSDLAEFNRLNADAFYIGYSPSPVEMREYISAFFPPAHAGLDLIAQSPCAGPFIFSGRPGEYGSPGLIEMLRKAGVPVK